MIQSWHWITAVGLSHAEEFIKAALSAAPQSLSLTAKANAVLFDRTSRGIQLE